MNRYVPDWTVEDDSGCLTDLLPMSSQKKPTGLENELVELLWRNGHVVMHSQMRRRAPAVCEFKQPQKHEQSLGSSSNLIQEAESASWFQYPLDDDDSFEKEFCYEFFPEIETAETDKMNKDLVAEEQRFLRFGSTNDSNNDFTAASDAKQSTPDSQEHVMPPPRSHCLGSTPQSSCLDNASLPNFSQLSKMMKADMGSSSCQLGHKGSGSNYQAGANESSMMTVGSSTCGSNQVQAQPEPVNALGNDAAGIMAGVKEDAGTRLLSDRLHSKPHEVDLASSSGGSGCSFGREGQKNASNQSHKRKAREVEDSVCQSEDAEYESTEEKKQTQRPMAKRRSRAAEVHNLSERRRRDRINEKMKALQELIPHCNKTDKASMLDEAIEYLKSLQLQVQMMWMGSGMASMMFPGVQQYIPGIGMGMGHHGSMPPIPTAVQLPRLPLVNQPVHPASSANQTSIFPSPALSAVSFPNQMQNIHLPESYARYLGMHMMPPPQASNFCTYGTHLVQQNKSAAAPSSTSPASAAGAPGASIGNNKSG